MKMNKINTTKCDGCIKHCELSAAEYKNPCSAGFPNPYYYPTIDNTIMNAFISENGKTVQVQPSATAEYALLIAQQISELCNKHKMNAK